MPQEVGGWCGCGIIVDVPIKMATCITGAMFSRRLCRHSVVLLDVITESIRVNYPGFIRQFATKSSQTRIRRLEKLGIGPEGRRIPIANPRGIFPRMYKCLIVNQDGSTYHIRHHFPHKIITLPLDPSTLSEEEREAREKKKRRSKEYRYVSEDDHIDDDWDHSQYEDLIR